MQIFVWSFDRSHLWLAEKLASERRLHPFDTGSPFKDIVFVFFDARVNLLACLSEFSGGLRPGSVA